MKKFLLVAATLGVAAVTSFAHERAASACGGCFHPPEETPTVVTDHRMILSISQAQSTLYDQVSYQGNPSSFAWVLPIVGTVDVGLSAKIVFDTLDSQTQTTILAPPQNCPAAPTCQNSNSGFAASPSDDEDASSGGGVTVTKEQVVGPYLTVQLHADNGDSLQTWLTQNGFTIPADIAPVIDQYVAEKFDFLALKLIPGAGIQDMRPVRVTTSSANAVLPLRMVAAGTGATVGITLYTLAEGRYEAQNFPNFKITADELSWDWTQQRSDYTEIRATKEASFQGTGWETESSSLLLPQAVQSAVENHGYYGGYGYADAGTDDPTEAGARLDYDPVLDDQGNVIKTAVQVRSEDLAALFNGIPSATARVTRMRSDLAHTALNADLVMIASSDQSFLSPTRQVTKELNEPQCTVYNGCDAVGTAPRSEAAGDTPESFSCSTSKLERSSPLAMIGAGLGYVAFSILRARRRRDG